MGFQWARWAYERRITLADGGWSLILAPVALAALLGISDPGGRAELWAFAGEPLLGLLGGFLAARLVVGDRALAVLLMRRSLWRLWLERLGLVLVELALLDGLLFALGRLLPPEPHFYWAYLPWTGLLAGVFFASSASLIAVIFRHPLAGEIWTVSWALPSLLLMFPTKTAVDTGLGPFFPFPVWFIHRRLTAMPQVHPLFRASERVPEHLLALGLLSIILLGAHLWALPRLRKWGV